MDVKLTKLIRGARDEEGRVSIALFHIDYGDMKSEKQEDKTLIESCYSTVGRESLGCEEGDSQEEGEG